MGCGEARSKKDAQGKAAEMFCNLLAEKGLVDRRELPPSGGAEEKNLPNTETPSGGNFPPPTPPGPSHYPPPPSHPLQSNFQQQLHVQPGKHKRTGIGKQIATCYHNSALPLNVCHFPSPSAAPHHSLSAPSRPPPPPPMAAPPGPSYSTPATSLSGMACYGGLLEE